MPKIYNLRDKHRIPIPRSAIYCGRGTPYGNPFVGGTHGSRETVIRRFVEEVLPDLDVSALAGKDLVCWCKPLPCHCDSILAKANPLPDGLWWKDGEIVFECVVCGEASEWPAEIEDFDPDGPGNYCGGSPRCLP